MSEKAHGLQPSDESHRGLATNIAYDNVELHVGQDMPELKPVETGPLPPRTLESQAWSFEAGTIHGENRCSPLEAHEFSRGRMSRKLNLSRTDSLRRLYQPLGDQPSHLGQHDLGSSVSSDVNLDEPLGDKTLCLGTPVDVV